MTFQERIFVAGHSGMVGSAIVRQLSNSGYKNLVTRSHAELDLANQTAVRSFFQNEKIDRVILAAAKVGGIHANNTYPAEFIYTNLAIQNNVIHEAFKAEVNDLLFLGSSCIYPKHCQQPMREEHLLTGILEQTNESYAIAKIAGIKMCEAYNRQYGTRYRSVMPTNLYGPGDNYHLENSHVLPAMIRKYHLAKLAGSGDVEAIVNDENHYGEIPVNIAKAIGYSSANRTLSDKNPPAVILWGSGTPRREFLHVDDMAAASVYVLGLDQSHFSGESPTFLNIGTGVDHTIRETAELIAGVVGFEGETVFNVDKPDGTPRKLLDTTRINSLGWQPRFNLLEGVKHAYRSYMASTGR